MEPVNLKQLAQALNLSVATVSRALNNRGNTSQQTKARVLKLAKKLNYEPNPHASSLRRHDSKTIGVVLPEIDSLFYSQTLDGIEEVARDNNYHVLFYLTHDNYEQEVALIRLLVSGRIDGALLSIASTSLEFNHFHLLRERNIPTVFLNQGYSDLRTAQVTSDEYASAYMATHHLLESGCRGIIYLTVATCVTVGAGYMQGYTDALQEYNIPFDSELVLHAQATQSQEIAMIQTVLHSRRDINGIFASLESLAVSSYEACRTLGLTIFTDVKIVSLSTLGIAPFLHPPLTTVSRPANTIGKEAAKLLFNAILENRLLSTSESLEVKPELVVRASTSATC